MNKFYKRILNVTLTFALVLAFNMVAFAQGTTSISVSKSSAAVGDSITVSVSGTESGSITVKYTASMLTFSSCNVSGYKSEGNSVTFSGKEGDIVFTTTSEGTASIIVSSTANSGSSTTLTVGGASTAQSEPEPAPAPTEEATETNEVTEETSAETTEAAADTQTAAPADGTSVGTLNSNGGFDINGVAYVVSERYSESEMPAGFSKTTIKIGSSTYSEPTNGTLTLLYLKPADNTAGSGVFYLYNAEAGTVAPFLMLGDSKNYVILATPDAPLSASFATASLEVTGGTTTAYTIDGSEFFYVYGANKDGVVGWFMYDKTCNTVSRVDTSALSAASSESAVEEPATVDTNDSSKYIEKLNLYRKIIMGLIVLCVILLFFIINKAIKGHGDDDDDFDGDVFADTPKRTARKLPRSIVFKNEDEDEDDEEDFEEETDEDYYEDDEYYDEDDYDDEDDASKARYESESYEARRASSLNMMDLNDL